MKLTEQEKQNKRQRDALQHVCNKLISAFSFGKLKVWRDVYVTVGIDAATIASTYTNSNAVVTFPELKKYCDGLKSKLEDSIKGRSVGVTTDLLIDESKKEPLPPPTETQLTSKLDDDYGLVPSPNEKAYLYSFQKKACAELLLGFGIA